MDEGGVVEKKHNPYALALSVVIGCIAALVGLFVFGSILGSIVHGFTTGNWDFAIVLCFSFGVPGIILALYMGAINWERKH